MMLDLDPDASGSVRNGIEVFESEPGLFMLEIREPGSHPHRSPTDSGSLDVPHPLLERACAGFWIASLPGGKTIIARGLAGTHLRSYSLPR